ncbi:MAG: penicillin acylase family protein [Ectothiorhodospiraceae bacterium]|nr:penicillin acylase family protein [Ectothiorhodospiraceae bacterium]
MKPLVVRILLFLLLVTLAVAGAATWWAWQRTLYQVDGELILPGLKEPVQVYRDERGIPFLYAEDLQDLYMAQGFVTAQHRLFQLTLYRELIAGRLAEIMGESGIGSDRLIRLLDLQGNAERHAKRLGPETRQVLQAYADGINAYVEHYRHEHPLELRLVGLEPRAVTPTDLMAIAHFVSFSQSQTYPEKLVMQRIRDRLGDEAALRLLRPGVQASLPDAAPGPLHSLLPDHPAEVVPGMVAVGSNAWAVAPERSRRGAAVLANDPHLDARVLPGVWHPMGLSVPGVEAVGAAIPGLPGLVVGRNRHVAFGVTNSYGDMQDVYIEHLDPDDPGAYLEGGRSTPLRTRTETIRVRDAEAPGGFREEQLVVRETRRGPVISDNRRGRAGERVLSLRWAAADPDAWEREPGFHALWRADSADALEDALRRIDIFLFNVVYATADGDIGFRATGRVPLRADNQGVFPRTVTEEDDWLGWLPADAMPAERNPERGWVAAANHDNRPAGLEAYYSFSFAPAYRHRRIASLLDQQEAHDWDDHWRYMQDTRNLQAARIRERMVDAMDRLLSSQPGLSGLAEARDLLAAWDLHDAADQAAPLIYQALYRELASQAYAPLLGDELTRAYLAIPYLWQERFDQLLLDDELDQWHGQAGPAQSRVEEDAVVAVLERLREVYGAEPGAWRWGEAHRITFISPLRPEGPGRDWLGGGSHPYGGSGETLLRAAYAQGLSFEARLHDSLRLLVDFAEPERLRVNLAGGVAARQFHPHFRDQLQAWLTGEPEIWAYGRDAVSGAAVRNAVLVPE